MLRLARAASCMTVVSACTAFGASHGPEGDAAASNVLRDGAPVIDGSGAEAGTASFCEAHAGPNVVFCDDFESTTPLVSDARWTDGYLSGSTVAVVEPADTGRSRALRARVAFPDGERSAWLRKELTPTAKVPAERSRYRLTFSFAATKSTVTYAAIGALWFTVQTNQPPLIHGAALTLAGKEARPTDPTGAPGRSLAVGWHQAAVTLEKGAAAWSRELRIDGQDLPRDVAADLAAARQLDVRVGVYYAHGVDGEVDVLFDDVLVEAL